MGNENVKYERREYVPPEGFVVLEGFKVRAIDDRPVTYEYMVALCFSRQAQMTRYVNTVIKRCVSQDSA